MYVVHCSLYVQHTHCDCVFTLAGPAHLARISKIITRQKKRDVNDGRKNSSESSCYAYIYCYFYVFTQLYKSLKYGCKCYE